jgi:hypothetical protein
MPKCTTHGMRIKKMSCFLAAVALSSFGKCQWQLVCRFPLPIPKISVVVRIRIRMFLGLPDPDPLVRSMDPDPEHSIIKQK